MYYIGVDPSLSNTGLVVLNNDMQPELVKESKAEVVKSTSVARLAVLRDFLISNLGEYKEHVYVGYEDYSYRSVNKSFTIGELGGVYKFTIYQLWGREPYLISPGKLKLFATGYGGADKKMMVATANKEGFKQESHDICDAYFLAKYAFYKHKPERAADLDINTKLIRNRLEVCLNG